jgi:putative protein-disulfide isomerase
MDNEIIYIADPMCSWCWGFAPAAVRLEERFAGIAAFRLVLGGLRPGERAEPLDRRLASLLDSHWRRVTQLTGQPINCDFLQNEGFLFDTEPPSRAVVAVRRLAPQRAFAFFRGLQRAFYVDNVDITREDSYALLLAEHDIDPASFTRLFHDKEIQRETYRDFDTARRLGAEGFPTVVLRRGRELALLTVGYQRVEHLLPAVARHFEAGARGAASA